MLVYDPAQEAKVHDYLQELNSGALPPKALTAIFREVISASRDLQKPMTIAFLGPEATFSHLAARLNFGESSRYFPQTGISRVFDEVEKGTIDWGVVPVENSLEGAINTTLDRLITTPLKIRAEIYLRISQCLISSAKNIKDIKKIYSNPHALAQCQIWLKTNLPNCVLGETESTAAAVQMVRGKKNEAAIGSSLAGKIYGLNLLAEGIPKEKIFLVGNVMIDTLMKFRDKAAQTGVLDRLGLKRREYAVVTLHRPSNVDDREQLVSLVNMLTELSRHLPVVFPVHPRTRERMEGAGLTQRGVILVEPLGYLEFLRLTSEARLVLTDSGGIQEETTILQVACLTMRENTERPITIENGTNRLVGTDPETILQAALDALDAPPKSLAPPELWDGKASSRILDVLERSGNRIGCGALRHTANAPEFKPRSPGRNSGCT